MKISIIIPTLNEAKTIRATLNTLQPLRALGHEVLIVDGGSTDSTIELADTLADHCITSPRGRGRQMNEAARIATGDILLFLHADTVLPANAVTLISTGKDNGYQWGRFDVRLSGTHPLLRIIEFFMNFRSRLSGITTGDQALFVDPVLFKKLGGFPELPLMEDIAFSRLLKNICRPLCLDAKVITSSRRWEENGILRTIFLMWRLRLNYFFGCDTQQLANKYEKSKT